MSHFNICIIIYQRFPLSRFHLIDTSATRFRFSFLAYWLPCRKFHEEYFLSQKFFYRSNRTWDIREKQNFGARTCHSSSSGSPEGWEHSEGSFPHLPRHIFTKSCFSPMFFQMSLATRLCSIPMNSLFDFFSDKKYCEVKTSFSWELEQVWSQKAYLSKPATPPLPPKPLLTYFFVW